MNLPFLGCLCGVLLCGTVFAEGSKSAPNIPANTLSPDKCYGINVPALDDSSTYGNGDNKLIEIKSKRVLGIINAPTAYAHMNHGEVLPTWWSKDNTYVLWQVYGKWGMYTQVLVHIKDGQIDWELDVLTALQRAILTRTEAADPKAFLKAKKHNWGDGSAYPEKFTVDSRADQTDQSPLAFPVHFHVYLTSNPKALSWTPDVDSSLEADLAEDGTITVRNFRMGKSNAPSW